MGSHTAFFYGTLMAPPVLHRVIYGTNSPTPLTHPSMQFLRVRPALLQNYRRHRVSGMDYPAIIPEEGGCVRGSVVSGLTDGDIWRLDVFEGSQYTRGVVDVEVIQGEDVLGEQGHEHEHERKQQKEGHTEAHTNGHSSTEHGDNSTIPRPELVSAETYIWSDPITHLERQEWDFEDFKKHKMRAWMGADAAGWSDSEDEEVEVDEGFADVDRAVAAAAAADSKKGQEKKSDPTGGRGVNGVIGRQLKEEQARETA